MEYLFSLHTIGPNDLHPSLELHFKTFRVFLIDIPRFPIYSTTQSYVPNAESYQIRPLISFQCACEKFFLFLLNAVFAMVNMSCVLRVCFAQFCFHVTKVAEIFYNLLLFLICRNLHCGWLP
jgi:hypothetical protein